jgi:hypothetical protein
MPDASVEVRFRDPPLMRMNQIQSRNATRDLGLVKHNGSVGRISVFKGKVHKFFWIKYNYSPVYKEIIYFIFLLL